MNAKAIFRAVHNGLLALIPEKLRYVMLENACRRYSVTSVISRRHCGSFEGVLAGFGMFALWMRYHEPACGCPRLAKFSSEHQAERTSISERTFELPLFHLRATHLAGPSLHRPDPGNFMRLLI